MTAIVFALPWILLTLYLLFVFKDPPALPEGSGQTVDGNQPMVSVVVPARNEELNIIACVESLTASDYSPFEILVVDDQSEDQTAARLREWTAGREVPVRIVMGGRLPEGWFGKPWACWQGAQRARGGVLLFTDADTLHSPDLMGRTVQELLATGADALTLVGRQIMGSFWEKILQPQFFLLLAARYPRTGTPKKPHQWRNAVANGQYLLFTREAYESMGGHRAVAGEVVEDVRLAQRLIRLGMRLLVREAEGLRTRMYRSFPGLVEGWSKNIATAALQTTASWLRPVIFPLSVGVGITLWLLPPAALAWSWIGDQPGILRQWALLTTGLGVFIWGGTSARMEGNPIYGLLFPLGALAGLYIFLRSWWMGGRIRWKGRGYRMKEQSRRDDVPRAGQEAE